MDIDHIAIVAEPADIQPVNLLVQKVTYKVSMPMYIRIIYHIDQKLAFYHINIHAEIHLPLFGRVDVNLADAVSVHAECIVQIHAVPALTDKCLRNFLLAVHHGHIRTTLDMRI